MIIYSFHFLLSLAVVHALISTGSNERQRVVNIGCFEFVLNLSIAIYHVSLFIYFLL